MIYITPVCPNCVSHFLLLHFVFQAQEAQTQWTYFFLTGINYLFDYIPDPDSIKIIVTVVGELRNTMKPSHNTGQIHFQIWGQYQGQYIPFSFYVLAVFQKGHLETPKWHMETKWYWGSYEV